MDKIKILLVDDEPNILEGLRRMLRSMRKEFEMHFAENAKEALELSNENDFDVVVSDMRMPVMDGIEAAESIRSREMRRSWVVSEEFKQVYIIAMTARTHSVETLLPAPQQLLIWEAVEPVEECGRL